MLERPRPEFPEPDEAELERLLVKHAEIAGGRRHEALALPCLRAADRRARIVAGGLGICADCAYLAEYGDTLRLPRNLRRGTGSKQPPQVESLFPPEKYTRR